MANINKEEGPKPQQQPQPEIHDDFVDSLNDLFNTITTKIKSQLQGKNNLMTLVEKMNVRVAEEYCGFGDVAAGLRVYVEQLKSKSGSFDEGVHITKARPDIRPGCQTSRLASVLDLLKREAAHTNYVATKTMSTTTMGPPPPKPEPELETQPKEGQGQQHSSQSSSTIETTKTPMGPPPLKNPNPPQNAPEESFSNSNAVDDGAPENPAPERDNSKQTSSLVPYTIPEWSGPPCHHFYLEVLKDGCIIDQFYVYEKGAYLFGRVDLCDFVLEHPTISRFHSVIQFKRNGDAYLYDLDSTHGTFVNKNQVEKRVYMDLHVGDVVRFGQSSRLYIFQGPAELLPPEKDLKYSREAKIREEMLDREASLRRARHEASLADGISWGMGEDAVEEAEDDDNEVTWQTYRGQLTEKQEKTREKIIKRTEKIAHMRKEIDAIRAKDIAQGGLTQGQQTQIARNEQRITQIMEELENLEETLNESIRESIGARGGNIYGGKKKGAPEDDEEFTSDDDEFYDRTKKKFSVPKAGEKQSVETVDTLLDKRDIIMKEMKDKEDLLLSEKNRIASDSAIETEAGDALDAYMSGLSSQLVIDKTEQLQKEMSTLQSQMDRILYLLKIADPTGEAAKKRDSKTQLETPGAAIKKQPPIETKKSSRSRVPEDVPLQNKEKAELTPELNKKSEAEEILRDSNEGKTSLYAILKPQWLGAVEDREMKETQQKAEALDRHEPEPDDFVAYNDRKKILVNADNTLAQVDSNIENAAPGLIIRKQKQGRNSQASDDKALDQSGSSSAGAELLVQDAVALLLKHKRGYHAEEDNRQDENPETFQSGKDVKKPKKAKRVLGPEKPSFLNNNSDYETWVPPEGQSGDGRTSLNDRYGY
ncbi:FHA domain-containing protein/BLOC1_2 domain-containing protein [Cephalotus follicularis]|uniref:FHA domain-containing protein/BLOC1_2 domain-containing protein n=1 Tax=Cephalotus follicularis TaxID=3775 RepID=A0A1Q3AWF0_CEPFO|nr:FHA domain-containing protein/BLOC1_2 domain-containing protein [Cephalotus follicularis]